MAPRKRENRRPPMHTQSRATRRKLAEAYRRQADDPKLPAKDRAAFARMADAWERSLSEE